MNKKVIFTVLVLIVAVILFMVFNGQSSKAAKNENSATITIAYQGGIGYAPVHVMEAKKLVEKNFNGNITVNYIKLDSGAAINEGIIGGTIDVGCMGLAPAITGVSRGIPYKVISNLCSQSHGLMSNDKNIKSLADIKPEDKIALVGTGSIQHILLSMAAEKVLGNPNALDINIQNMSHAEGMASLESGTVKLHLTSSPFIYQERANNKYVELKELSQVWPSGNTFLLAMASNKLAENKALFAAIEKSFAEAIRFINENKNETAELETKYLGLNLDTVNNYLSQPDSQFFPELRGAKAMSEFMVRAGFIDKGITMEQFCFPSVNGN